MRGLSTPFKNDAAERVVRISPLVEILYPSGAVRAWCGLGNLSWNGQTWSGVGTFGEVSAVQERAGPDAANITLTLSGIPTAMLTAAMDAMSQGSTVTVWLATFSEAWAVNGAFIAFRGQADSHKVTHGGDVATIQLNVETRMAQLKTALVSRYTDAEQQALHPGDTGFRYIAAMAERPLYWGIEKWAGTLNAGMNGGVHDGGLYQPGGGRLGLDLGNIFEQPKMPTDGPTSF